MINDQIVVLDAGTGNLFSVQQALMGLGANIVISNDPEIVRKAKKIIMPGVGAFSNFMYGIEEKSLDSALRKFLDQGKLLLGICVGMQALFEKSFEMGIHRGLNLIEGTVDRFAEIDGRKIPHTGWNQLWFQTSNPILTGISSGDYVYFNHSYYCQPVDSTNSVTLTDYEQQFCSIVQHNNIFGVQFHPEKSQKVGLRILQNFLNLEEEDL